MSSCTATEAGTVTVAFSVAKFTDAKTFSIVLSFFSTLAAHAAHVIPWIESSTSLGPDGASPVNAADDMPPPPSSEPASQDTTSRRARPEPGSAGTCRWRKRRTGNLHTPQRPGNTND